MKLRVQAAEMRAENKSLVAHCFEADGVCSRGSSCLANLLIYYYSPQVTSSVFTSLIGHAQFVAECNSRCIVLVTTSFPVWMQLKTSVLQTSWFVSGKIPVSMRVVARGCRVLLDVIGHKESAAVYKNSMLTALVTSMYLELWPISCKQLANNLQQPVGQQLPPNSPTNWS